MVTMSNKSESRPTSSQVRGLTEQADELTADELDHVWGGKPSAAPQSPPVPYLTVKMQEAQISSYSL
jgi:hypothetical protein